ncbi:50S ribosomal protein L3 [Candidatus Campbellbacteria bacterium CG11_big_fil_rev_8_21_14_0_20_44_21]|uniref:50S ribosomal protein L3 n=1 Tax=Candidatus Campbellbacteria bacterium CG22_combo_CG10-13_8_21_14_all_43_18 TaxID=1974530 RepID=A0A2H0DWJ0_9BACT|nr:MAG: 50S ribosomal protein L3 [Candidatus Campbellbacteria bacterium CG22_combo_CG10-13_8_21_14_all_43_18]PIR24360.1 MAG: 50S ribosomal protein L3 [Candidatus Campbellbacteria bacterium CG11_big_fil_rev_8_21_14_0_20_44_21]
MTQVFNEEGRVFPATVLKAGPLFITGIKTEDKDGYTAIQVGAGKKKEKNINKAQKKIGNYQKIKEFRTNDVGELKVGDKIELDAFQVGDVVTISGISKGKGFQGGVKRHGFSGGRRSHGNKHAERQPGSIGAGGIQRVLKGTRMAGRMGGERVTVKNLKILNIDKENGLLYISGAVPGRRGTLVEVRGASKN